MAKIVMSTKKILLERRTPAGGRMEQHRQWDGGEDNSGTFFLF
jgi:hypothetical protein